MTAESFIREVEEELQRERLLKLWQRFSPYVIAAAILVVVGTAAKVGYDYWRTARIQAQARAFAEVETRLGPRAELADTWLKLANEARGGFAALAQLHAAAALRDAGRSAEAVETLRALAAARQDELFVELAHLLAAWYRVDQEAPASLKGELAPLAAAGRPFRHTARELQALAALRAGDRDEARALLLELSKDASILSSQQQRLQILLELAGSAGGEETS